MLPDFEKLWPTLVAAGVRESRKSDAARCWVVLWICLYVLGFIGSLGIAWKFISDFSTSGLTSAPSHLKDKSESPSGSNQPSPSVENIHGLSPALCIKIKSVASDFNLSDTNDHLAAKAAIDSAIASFPLLEKRVLALTEWKHLDEQWISGNPSAALSRLIDTLNCN